MKNEIIDIISSNNSIQLKSSELEDIVSGVGKPGLPSDIHHSVSNFDTIHANLMNFFF